MSPEGSRIDSRPEIPYDRGLSADEVQFEWDDAKADSNVKKHGIPFEAAAAVFDAPNRLEEDDAFDRGE